MKAELQSEKGTGICLTLVNVIGTNLLELERPTLALWPKVTCYKCTQIVDVSMKVTQLNCIFFGY